MFDQKVSFFRPKPDLEFQHQTREAYDAHAILIPYHRIVGRPRLFSITFTSRLLRGCSDEVFVPKLDGIEIPESRGPI